MKNKKLVVASMLVGISALALGTATACDGLPTWLGGKEPTYKVVISINGTLTEMEVGKDVIPQKPADPVKEGFDFKGWYLDEACTKEYTFDKPLEGDCSLYAYFTEKTYTVTFVVEGKAEAVTFTWSQTPSIATPKKDGYAFKSWCLDEACTQVYPFTMPVRADLTVYAKFVEAYKVNYVVSPDASTDENEKETVETELNTAPVRPADPKVEGYDFAGWYMDADFTVECNFDTVLEAGTSIYAKLVEKEYTITYMVANTDVVLDTDTCKYWSIPTQPDTPYYQGEYFFGWYLDEAYANSYDFSYSFKKDTTVYAQFMEYKPVSTVEELIAIAEYPAGNYALTNDINLELENWEPIAEFSGKFDGAGYKIYDFSMDTTSANTGFFVVNNGTIKNLTLKNFSFTSNYGGAGIAGVLVATNNGTVENCVIDNPNDNNENGITYRNHVTVGSSTWNSYYGGLIGKNTATAVVKNCDVVVEMVLNHYFGVVYGDGWDGSSATSNVYFGGAIGLNEGSVSNLSVTLKTAPPLNSDGTYGYTVNAQGTGGNNGHHDYSNTYLYMAGIASRNTGTMTKCDATVDMLVRCTNNNCGYPYVYMAGVVDCNTGTVTESYAKSTLENTGNGSTVQIGGFIRRNEGFITDCYAETVIQNNTTSGYVGGFVAHDLNEIERCYVSGTISGTSTNYVGGFVGYTDTNSKIKASFSTVNITGTSAKMGIFVGGFASESSTFKRCYYAQEATVMNGENAVTSTSVTGVNSMAEATLYLSTTLVDSLYWKTDVWVIDDVTAPTLVWAK